MLLDGETFDLVQHIDTVLAAMAGHELEDRVNPELMQSVLEIATPVCRTPADVDAELRKLRGYVRDVASEKGLRVGSAGTHPVLALRAPADHRAGPLPRARRPDAVRRPPRADLRPAHPRRRRRSREGDPGRQRPARRARVAARPLRELALLAGRADGPLVVTADGVRGLPSVGPAAALPRLRRLRRRSSASWRRPAASRTTRTSGGTSACTIPLGDRRGPDLRRGDACRARGRARRVLPGARQASLRAVRERRADPPPTTGSSPRRTSGWPERYGLEAPSWTLRADAATGCRSRS